MRKKAKSFTLSPKVIALIKKRATEEKRSESQIVDIILEKNLSS